MNLKTICSVVIISLFSSLITLISAHLLTPKSVQADNNNGTVMARNFVLVDDNGNHRGGIGFENKEPVIYLYDSNGVARAYLAVSATGPIFGLRNAQGKSDITISTSNNSKPCILLNSIDDEKRLIMMLKDGKQPALLLYDSKSKPRFLLTIDNDNPSMAMLDQEGIYQFSMQALGKQGALLSFHDNGSDSSAALGMRGAMSFLNLKDKDSSGLFTGAQPGKGPALVLKERGKITWAAGSSGATNDARELERGIDRDAMTKDWLR